MRRINVLTVITMAASAALVSAIPPSALAAGNAQKPAARSAAPSQSSGIAAGAVEDSLRACLDRIPKDATAGQRLIAEQSCQRDETERHPAGAGDKQP